MEESANVPSGDSQQSVGDDSESTGLVKYETYKKVLGEKKSRDEQLRQLQDELSSYKHEKLALEGKKDELIKTLKEKAEQFEKELKQTKEKYIWTSVESQVKNFAAAQGCTNTDALMKLLDKEELRSLEMGEDYQIDKNGLSSMIDGYKKKYSDIGLFQKKDLKVFDVVGRSNIPNGPSIKDLMASAKTPAEMAELIKRLPE